MRRKYSSGLVVLGASVIVCITVTAWWDPITKAGVGLVIGVPGSLVRLVRAFAAVLATVLVLTMVVRRLVMHSAEEDRMAEVAGWSAVAWLAIELYFRQRFTGWAVVFGRADDALAVLLALVSVAAIRLQFGRSRISTTRRFLGKTGPAFTTLLAGFAAWISWIRFDGLSSGHRFGVGAVGALMAGLGIWSVGASVAIRRDYTGVCLLLGSMLLLAPVLAPNRW